VEFFGGRDGMAFHGAGGMHGGYPNATGYRLYAKNTNLKEIFQNQKDYPLGDPDPSNGEFERLLEGDITRKPYAMMYPISLDNYDVIYWSQSGGPGYGDPLERDLESVKKDLNDALYTKNYVFNIYGVVADYDETTNKWSIDDEATKKRREEIKKERLEKSVPFEEYWQQERKTILDGKIINVVRSLYSESIELSRKYWAKEFKQFWNLPEDFKLEGV
jgi:acetone carboxylase alpha subunit